ncbi:arabinosidase [Paenibacillus sp. Soil787]|uniref:arabinosidase n=1 Tax=Paenibacillus sp. Soil787 TaxID=1736411 RepID=UPI000AB6952C|nr:arabinosidase [Paenibacillus sp. Soil787]
MLVDGFQEQYYSAYRSFDLKKWEDVSESVQLPPGARHGAVLKLSAERMPSLLLK